MKFTPNRKISYKHIFRPAGVPFDIDAKDAAAMSACGEIELPKENRQAEIEPPRRGRPRKDESK